MKMHSGMEQREIMEFRPQMDLDKVDDDEEDEEEEDDELFPILVPRGGGG